MGKTKACSNLKNNQRTTKEQEQKRTHYIPPYAIKSGGGALI